MMTRGRVSILSAALVAAAAGVTALAGPASAQVKPAQAPAAANYTWFQIENPSLGGCIQEDGTTDAVYTGGCSSNPSDYWRWTAAHMLLNEHSGLCITSTSGGPGVYMASCSNNSVQIWNYEPPVVPGGWPYLANNHTGEWLAEAADGSLTQVDSVTAAMDWNVPAPS
jgi:hypothetical protein